MRTTIGQKPCLVRASNERQQLAKQTQFTYYLGKY